MSKSLRLRLTAFSFLIIATSGASVAQTETKLVPESLGVGDFFGRAVALSADGRYAVVGASEEVDADTTDGGMEAGGAYVFERTVDGWTERQRLSASDPDSLSNFGRSVAISDDGSRIFVGAPYNGLGAAYVFVREGAAWVEEAKLEVIDNCGSPFQCRFGWAVATSAAGDVVVVGAPDDEVAGVRYGSLNVYRRTPQGWGPVTKLAASGGSYVGIAAAISADGRRAFAGTHRCCGSGQTGRVYVFDESDGSWAQTAVLSGRDGEPDNRFGNELAVTPDGNWLLVGADGASDVGSSSGAAYVFGFDGAAWTERQRLTASDAADQDLFGSGVALTADASTLVIGALGQDAGALASGAAYVFVRDGGTWEEHTVFAPSEPGERDFFGTSISVTPTGSLALFGVWTDDDRGDTSGSAYVYDLPRVLPVEEPAGSPFGVRLAVYPNPANGRASLTISLSQPEPTRVVLLDLLGREVRSLWHGPLSSGDHTLALDTSVLASGTYFLRIATANGAGRGRLVVQH